MIKSVCETLLGVSNMVDQEKIMSRTILSALTMSLSMKWLEIVFTSLFMSKLLYLQSRRVLICMKYTMNIFQFSS